MDLGVSSICGSVVPIFIFSNVKNKKQIFKNIEISECLMEKHIYIYILKHCRHSYHLSSSAFIGCFGQKLKARRVIYLYPGHQPTKPCLSVFRT